MAEHQMTLIDRKGIACIACLLPRINMHSGQVEIHMPYNPSSRDLTKPLPKR